jgi:hypothetical protein
MKCGLTYPKIPENSNGLLDYCVAFEKYDGTNMHWCWNYHEGWHKFGTRRTQFNMDRRGISEFQDEHDQLSNAPFVFNEKYRDKLTMHFSQNNKFAQRNVIVFTEFHGPNSFAGEHSLEDQRQDKQDLTIIDVSVGNDFLLPHDFINEFNTFDLARVVYTGKYTGQFMEDVRKGKFKVNEGVVCKGIVDGKLFMTKVKTKDYLKRLEHK